MNPEKQQGDVLINPISESVLPSNLKKIDRRSRGFVIAEGETTGHAHVIDNDVEIYEDETGHMYIKVLNSVEIHHEEHKAIPLEPGWNEIGIIVEIDPFTEQIHEVVD